MDLQDAVYTGVDGIGLGGAQILRYMDKQTGMHGPYVSYNTLMLHHSYLPS
jgi:hypothetical protein